jgi:hypothetical protein
MAISPADAPSGPQPQPQLLKRHIIFGMLHEQPEGAHPVTASACGLGHSAAIHHRVQSGQVPLVHGHEMVAGRLAPASIGRRLGRA